ncbi:FAD-dependent monooxygenase [Nocardia asteroides]|uniref:FAD-dependent monooxygenase n=1 Tax=Nocardia asteroides TaxID=1824 RepID=UPI001E424D02|nr:FAD-dependent monooxygenase [Nocardia asteroides]UGT60855.1 FAD-dependent monooxygenase [Nocardia asteroides]
MDEVLIAGGGIGGLATALAVLRAGKWPVVLERAAEQAVVGSGLSLWPNAIRALDALGVGAQVRARAVPDASGGIRDAAGRPLLRVDARVLKERFGEPIVVHRAELMAILREALPAGVLRTGVGVAAADESGRVVTTAGERSAELVVGADGIRSVVRRAVAGEVEPRYAGYTAWRAVVTPSVPVTEFGESWGRGQRFGFAALAGGRVYCFATANAPAAAPDGGLAELRERFADWHDPIPALLAAADPAELLRHDIYDLPALPRFTAGRIALVGDAAHAMTPDLGQGACQALEDAVTLGAVLAGDGDLRRYDALRRPRTQRIGTGARRMGQAGQLSARPLVALRNAVMRRTPASAQLGAMAELLDWAPTEPTPIM